jgi:hypothetical protein
MGLLAAFAMNAIMNDRRRQQQPQPEQEDEDARGPVPARDADSQAHVGDEQRHSDHQDEPDLGPHQVAHVSEPTSRTSTSAGQPSPQLELDLAALALADKAGFPGECEPARLGDPLTRWVLRRDIDAELPHPERGAAVLHGDSHGTSGQPQATVLDTDGVRQFACPGG